MKQISFILILSLLSLSTSVKLHHRFTKSQSEAKRFSFNNILIIPQSQDFDICSELNLHINNLQIDAESYDNTDLEFPNNEESLGQTFLKQIEWTKMQDIATNKNQEFKIFGDQDIKASDIKQGDIGDCYFLAALSGLANSKPEFLRQVFDEQSDAEKQKGIFTTNWIINGQTVKVSVDSWIPTYVDTKEPVFASFKNDFEFWPLILEKAWAKIYGSYSNINKGCSGTVYKALTNAPPFYYTHSLTMTDQLWKAIYEAIEAKRPLSVGTQSYSIYGLPQSHAYAPIGTCQHQFENGTVLRLIKMQNPWGVELYNGPFSDKDAEWTEELRGKCGSVNANDGEFFIPLEIYKMVFVSTSGAKLQDNFKNYVLVSDEIMNDGLFYEDSYEVRVKEGHSNEKIYVGVDFLDYRFNAMLPEECQIKDDHFSAYIMTPDFAVVKKIFDDSSVSSYHAELTGYDKYYVFLRRRVESPILKNYVVNVYAPLDSVAIEKTEVVRTQLFADNILQNKHEGKVSPIQPELNLIANVPITGDSFSSGVIIDNESLAKILTIELVFYTKLYDIVSDICEIDNSYSSNSYKKFKCKSIVYPHETRAILIQHNNEFGSPFLKVFYKYSVQ